MPGTNQGTIIGRIVSSSGAAIPQDTISDLYRVSSTLPRHVGRGLTPSSPPFLPLYQTFSRRVSSIKGSMVEVGIFMISFLWDSHDIGVADPSGIPYQAQILVPSTRNSSGSPLSYRTTQLRGRRLKPAVSLGAISRSFPAVGITGGQVQSVTNKVAEAFQAAGGRVPRGITSETPSPEYYVLYDVLSISIP